MLSFSQCPSRAAHQNSRLRENAPLIDRDGAFPVCEMKWLGEAGLLSAPVPVEYGGAGLGTAPNSTPALLQTLWHIGSGNLAVGRLYEGHVNALQLVAWFGNAAQKQRFFDDARAGHIFGVWNTQGGNGVRFFPANGGWKIEGEKTFCSGANHISRPIVTGELEGAGWQMTIPKWENHDFAVDTAWWQPLGMRATASFRVDFGSAKLDESEILGAPGDYYGQPHFSGGAIRFCAVQLGGAAALFDATREFLRETGRTQDPFQQARVGQMAATLQSGWNWLQSAGNLWDSQPPAPQMVAFAAAMRLETERICLAILEMAEKSVGARGLLRPHPIERIGRDLTIYLKQPHLDEIAPRVGKFALENEVPAHELFA